MRHFAANYIFDGKSLIKNSLVSVDDSGSITFVGKENDALIERPRMIFFNGILAPGFINSHCHLELSDYKKTDEQAKGLSYFISKILTKRGLFNNTKEIASYDKSMYEKGINLVADIVNTDKTIDIKAKSKIFYLNFIEISSTNNFQAENKIKWAEKLASKFTSSGLSSNITLHSFYSISHNLFPLFTNNSRNKILSIHFLESDEEEEFFRGKRNSLFNTISKINPKFTPIAKNIDELYALVEKLSQSSRIILVHNVKADINKTRTLTDCYYCLCPASNLFLNNELPSSDFVYSNIDKIIVGTDSIASNTDLDVYKEIQLLSHYYPDLQLIDLLKMITSTAAEALNTPEFGKFKIGTKPGIVLINNIDLFELKLTNKSFIKRII